MYRLLHRRFVRRIAAPYNIEFPCLRGNLCPAAGGRTAVYLYTVGGIDGYRRTSRGILDNYAPCSCVYLCGSRCIGRNLPASGKVGLRYIEELFPAVGCPVIVGRPFRYIERTGIFIDTVKTR